MTNEEIDAARERLIEFLDDVYNEAPDLDTDDPMELIDALCAAARQPKRLVGRRVRVSSPTIYGSSCGLATVADGPHESWTVDIDDAGSYTVNRDDFELLEDDDAE